MKNIISATVLSALFMFNAQAADTMDKEKMEKEHMSKTDGMKNDHMGKKDNMSQ